MTTTSAPTHTVTVNEQELNLLRNALEIMRSDFGHDEATLRRDIQRLIDKLPRPTDS